MDGSEGAEERTMKQLIVEREVSSPQDLCNENGLLHKEAIGWSRFPLHHCEIKGHWLRKKRWNFWFISSAECVLSMAVVHLDYVGLGFVHFVDLATNANHSCTVKIPFGQGITMGTTSQEEVAIHHPGLSLSFEPQDADSGTSIRGRGRLSNGEHFSLELSIPSVGESLNVVIPWNEKRFHFTSKQNGRPVSGTLKMGEKIYLFEPSTALASLDFGRGVWPYQTMWNWTTCSFRQGEDVIGFNFGSGWTDGTGMTENGFVLNGVLHKLSEPVRFRYDQGLMKPWEIETIASDRVKLVFIPQYQQRKYENYGIVRSSLYHIIGRFNGCLTTADGHVLSVVDQIGICEEQLARW